MKKVLVIAYYFPPLGMGGVQAIMNCCRYLPDFGWTPVVLTVKPIKYFAYDQDFLQQVKCEVFRSESLDPLRLMKIFRNRSDFGHTRKRYQGLSNSLFIPDNKIGWLPFGLEMGARIVKEEGIDAIFATVPPYTGLLIGYLLKKRYNLPLVADFRDPWPYFPYPTPLHRWASESLKRNVVTASDAILAVNEPVRSDLMSTRGLQSEVTVFPPGYNPEHFQDLNPQPSTKFTIVYMGSFIPPRTPLYLLRAISILLHEKKINRNDIAVELIGFSGQLDPGVVRELGLENIIRIEGYRPHKYCLERLASADLLWIMMDEVETEASTGKIGDYLGACKPILGTVPESPCADIIRDSNAGVIVPPRDVPAIARAIYDFYMKYKAGQELMDPQKSSEGRKKYSWVNLTKGLANIFDNLV